MSHAPIALFAFRRPELTERTLRTLLANPEAQHSKVFVFCDGPRDSADEPLVARTKALVKSSGLAHLELVERPENVGLAANVIDGVSQLCSAHGCAIVLEDDLILSPRFLRYMNDALERYRDEPSVYAVSGFMYPVDTPSSYDALFLPFISSWGWATWARAWKVFDPRPSPKTPALTDRATRRRFDLDGSYGFSRMLRGQMAGRNNSWAIRWYLSVFERGGLSLFPRASLVENGGFELGSTHCAGPRPHHASSTASDHAVLNFPPVAVDEAAFARVRALLAADSTLLARGLRRARRLAAELSARYLPSSKRR